MMQTLRQKVWTGGSMGGPSRCGAAGRFTVVTALVLSACGDLDYDTWGAPLGDAGHVLVLFHGYGASAHDLNALAIDLKAYGAPKDTCYVLVEGPRSVGFGRAWYRNPDEIPVLREKIQKLLARLLRKSRRAHGALYVGGFSQGATVAVDTALTGRQAIAGVVAFSGGADTTGAWRAAVRAKERTRFFLAHGSSDAVVPFQASNDLKTLLEAAGHDVQFFGHADGHNIPSGVIKAAGAFLNAE